jgi:hypothetical protein
MNITAWLLCFKSINNEKLTQGYRGQESLPLMVRQVLGDACTSLSKPRYVVYDKSDMQSIQ